MRGSEGVGFEKYPSAIDRIRSIEGADPRVFLEGTYNVRGSYIPCGPGYKLLSENNGTISEALSKITANTRWRIQL